jgi:hypothetical protein
MCNYAQYMCTHAMYTWSTCYNHEDANAILLSVRAPKIAILWALWGSPLHLNCHLVYPVLLFSFHPLIVKRGTWKPPRNGGRNEKIIYRWLSSWPCLISKLQIALYVLVQHFRQVIWEVSNLRWIRWGWLKTYGHPLVFTSKSLGSSDVHPS